MKQYRITTENLSNDSVDDCGLSPDDLVHSISASQYLGGLGADYRLAQIAQANANALRPVTTINKAQIMRENNIKPGTNEWFQLWFGNTSNKSD